MPSAAGTDAGPKRKTGLILVLSAIGVVLVAVATLLIVSATARTSPTASAPSQPSPDRPIDAARLVAPAAVVHAATTIPSSVYNAIGVNSPAVQVTAPIALINQPRMTLDGKTPAMIYYGAEYCPFCAAERWALVVALSRFGTWSNLKIITSSQTDVDPNTHSFSFYGALFTSPYLTFRGIEANSDIPTAEGSYEALQSPTSDEKAIIHKYSSPTYIPDAIAGAVSYPFIDINNVALISGASFDPAKLANKSWSQIASGLSDPNNSSTQAIVATANYITAAICVATKSAPSSVCNSLGVRKASSAL
jgi:hypothetical protein